MPEDTEQSSKTAWARSFGRAAAALTIAAVVGVLAALWLTTSLFDFSSDTASPEIQGNGGEESAGQEVEFSGVISDVSGSTVTVQASFGVATVLIDSQAEVEGELAPDVTVKVHATVRGDGAYLARQIEIMAPGVGEADGGAGADDDGQGSLGIGDGNTGRYEREAE